MSDDYASSPQEQCSCSYYELRCPRKMTQEDLLCDFCREKCSKEPK